MIRIILSFVIALHGLIHLMGFAKEWSLGVEGNFSAQPIIQFSGNTSKFIGLLWLFTCILILASALTYYYQMEWFLLTSGIGLFVSQALIILYWHDAKWGTIANVILLLLFAFASGRVNFEKMVNEEVDHLHTAASGEKTIISERDLSSLPPTVQTWLRNSGIVGRPMPANVYVVQTGSMRTDKHGEWMPFDAQQHFTVDPPGFVWKATIHADKFVDIVGRDKYINGQGSMVIKAMSLIPMANRSGDAVDQGTMIRYMAEMTWFPHAAVSRYLHWEEIDSAHARVTMRYKNVTASGIYTFGANGLPSGFEAQRYGEFSGKFSIETWSVTTTGYASFEGLPIGNTSEVTWKLNDGDFTWLRLSIVDIKYK